MVGALYALPVTECHGSFAVYWPQETDPSSIKPPIYIFYPAPHQRDVILVTNLMFPVAAVIVPGAIGAAMEEQGHLEVARVLDSVQYTALGLYCYLWSFIVFYYGLKFTVALRKHIMAIEARDNIPPKAFRLRDLKSGSPARYPHIMVNVMVIGRGCNLIIGASMAIIRAWKSGGHFLLPGNERWSHVMAVICVCMTLAYLAQYTLIAIHCSRDRTKSVSDVGAQTMQDSVVGDSHPSFSLLTLRFEFENTQLMSSRSLERALFQLAKSQQPGEEVIERSKAAGDAPSEAHGGVVEEEESIRGRAARSAIISFFGTASESRSSGISTIVPSSSRSSSGQGPQMPEFQMLQLQPQSSSRRPRNLEISQPIIVGEQKICVLKQQLQDAHQNLERLQSSYNQLLRLPAHPPREEPARFHSAESLQLLHLYSNIVVLQRQMKFTLRQLDSHIKEREPDIKL